MEAHFTAKLALGTSGDVLSVSNAVRIQGSGLQFYEIQDQKFFGLYFFPGGI